MSAIPLTVLPLIAYNLVGYGVSGADPWGTELFALRMPSGARWSPQLGDLLAAFAIAMLCIELRRAAIAAHGALINRTLSVAVLAVYAVAFATTDVAADSVFFILTTIALADVVAGISIRAARRRVGSRAVDEEEEAEEP